MTDLAAAAPPDLIDTASGLEAGCPIFALRRQREKVRLGTQASHDVLLDADLSGGLSRSERLMVCLYASSLSGAEPLADHYRALWITEAGPAQQAWMDAVLAGDTSAAATPRAAALVAYTATLTQRPIDGDRAALETLAREGLSTAEIVALSQLLGFLSFQVRLAAGVRALAELETAR